METQSIHLSPHLRCEVPRLFQVIPRTHRPFSLQFDPDLPPRSPSNLVSNPCSTLASLWTTIIHHSSSIVHPPPPRPPACFPLFPFEVGTCPTPWHRALSRLSGQKHSNTSIRSFKYFNLLLSREWVRVEVHLVSIDGERC